MENTLEARPKPHCRALEEKIPKTHKYRALTVQLWRNTWWKHMTAQTACRAFVEQLSTPSQQPARKPSLHPDPDVLFKGPPLEGRQKDRVFGVGVRWQNNSISID